MKAAVYGLPRSGKDYFIGQLRGVKHIRGSAWLNERAGGSFRSRPEHEQAALRREFIGFINQQADGHVVVDGHYAFPDELGGYRVVFTKDDGDCYDKFVYLDTPSPAIIQRMQESDKNQKYRSLEPRDVDAWKNFEIEGLRRECLKRNKDFVILDADTAAGTAYFDEILRESPITSSFTAAEEITEEILHRCSDKATVCLLDCDRTIASNDVTYEFLSHARMSPSVMKETFGDNRYSSYQFWKMAASYAGIAEYDRHCIAAARKALMNKALIEDVKKIPGCYFVGITSGLRLSWESIRQSYGFPDMIIGGSNADTDRWVVSDMLKGYTAKLLRERGKRVVAVGDSMGDRIMLEMAEHSYVVAQEKISASLQGCLEDGRHSIKQPVYNKIRFRGVQLTGSIHEDLV